MPCSSSFVTNLFEDDLIRQSPCVQSRVYCRKHVTFSIPSPFPKLYQYSTMWHFLSTKLFCLGLSSPMATFFFAQTMNRFFSKSFVVLNQSLSRSHGPLLKFQLSHRKGERRVKKRMKRKKGNNKNGVRKKKGKEGKRYINL